MKNALLFLLPLALLLGACHPDPISTQHPPPPVDYTVLPPVTQEGKNTFGCKVNGEVWVPRVPLFALTYRPIDVLVSEKDGSGTGGIYTTLVDIEENIDNDLELIFRNTGFMPISLCENAVYASFRTNNGKYYTSDIKPLKSNCIEITKIDSSKNIVSGTFHFTLFRDSTNLNDKIEITEGRFDLLYYPE